MTPDPYADLIGKTYTSPDEDLSLRVLGVWSINPMYMLCHDGRDEVIRPAGVIRRALQLQEEAAR